MEPSEELLEAERALRLAIEKEQHRQRAALDLSKWDEANPYPKGPDAEGRPYSSVAVYFNYRARRAVWREERQPYVDAVTRAGQEANEAARSAAGLLEVAPGERLDVRVRVEARVWRVRLHHWYLASPGMDSTATVSLGGAVGNGGTS